MRLFVFFSLAENAREEAADGNDLSFGCGQLTECALRFRFEIEIHFVRLDLRDRFPFLHRIAGLLVPTDDLSFSHRVAHLRHDHFRHPPSGQAPGTRHEA